MLIDRVRSITAGTQPYGGRPGDGGHTGRVHGAGGMSKVKDLRPKEQFIQSRMNSGHLTGDSNLNQVYGVELPK